MAAQQNPITTLFRQTLFGNDWFLGCVPSPVRMESGCLLVMPMTYSDWFLGFDTDRHHTAAELNL
jgi:hypothetical protein